MIIEQLHQALYDSEDGVDSVTILEVTLGGQFFIKRGRLYSTDKSHAELIKQ